MDGSFTQVAPFPLLIEIKNIDGAVTFATDNTLTQQIELILEEQTIEEPQMSVKIKSEDINNSCDEENKMGLKWETQTTNANKSDEEVDAAAKDEAKPEEMKIEYNCFECSETFDNREIFDIHMSGHTNKMKCAICNMVLKSLKNYEKHCLRCKPYECQICGRIVRFRPNFIKHMRVHSGQQSERHKYKCEVCKKEFMSFEYFKVHKKIHNENVNLTCDVCGKVFSALASLRGHTKLHTGMKLHKCEICGKGFGQRYNLKLHSRVHTNETKIFECNICKRKFYTQANYRNHMQTHEEGTEEPNPKSTTTSSGVQTRSSTNSVVQVKTAIKTEPIKSNDEVSSTSKIRIKSEVVISENGNSSNSGENACNDIADNCSNISDNEPSKYVQNFEHDLIDTNDLSNSLSYPNLFENDSISEGICLENDEKSFPFVPSSLDLQSSTTDGNFIRKEWVFGNYVVGEKLDDDIFSETTSFIYD